MNSFLLENIRLVTTQQVLENYGLWVQDGKIQSLYPLPTRPAAALPVIDGKNAYVLPGLIDLHIHGFAGVGPELGTPQALLDMSAALACQGVTAFCPTLYCAPPNVLEKQLCQLTRALGHETGAKIIGFHLEGPFISPLKPGVMKPQAIAPASVATLEKLYQAAQGHIASITLAPELKNIGPVIDFCREHHILVQAGHTNATYEEFLQGVQRGVRHVTHLFNAMSPFSHREPGVAGGALLTPDVSCEIIADGAHVHKEVVSFLRTVKAPDKLILVTDALRPTGQSQGPFMANGESVLLEAGAWHRICDHVLAGSALTMAQGVHNLVSWGYPLPLAARCASTNPAQRIGLKNTGKLETGYRADLTLLDENFTPLATFIDGKRIFPPLSNQ